MHISKLSMVNFRNFSSTEFHFTAGVNTVIGENGTGKTNLFRAIRLLLDESMLPAAYRLNEGDFHRGLTNWRGHWIVISAEFANITMDESVQALFVHGTGNLEEEPVDTATFNLIFRPRKDVRAGLAALTDGDEIAMRAILDPLTIDDYETVFTGRSTADFSDPELYRSIVGDFDNVIFSDETEFPELGAMLPRQLAVAKEVSFSHIQALRDVVQDFQNNRANPLRTLLRIKSGEIDTAGFKTIADKVLELNKSIEEWPDVEEISGDIKQTIKDAVGEAYSPSSLNIKSDLPGDADRLFQSLKLFVGEDGADYEGGIHELSLGGANLIYLTLKLLEFKYQKAKQAVANFLLIEEPEAHIHTHIQKTLFDRLNYSDTQIIYSTHSTQISEVSKVESMNIVGRDNGRCEAYQPSRGLEPTQIVHVQRYLDSVRSNLLFARSVLLVEGDAEEILIPALIKKVLGIGLDELGISLINIRSTGFENVALLFHDERIRKRCSIISDLDAAFFDTTADTKDDESRVKLKKRARASETSGAARKVRLDAFASGNQWVSTFYADHTLEVDFVKVGNAPAAVGVIDDVYVDPPTRATAKLSLESDDSFRYGHRILTMAKSAGKGWFAILLAGKLDHHVVIPGYLLDALCFAHPVISRETWFNIFTYRIALDELEAITEATVRESFLARLQEYRRGDLAFADVKSEFAEAFPSDRINEVLGRY
ncbi:putative ATP-dependent endonuclease of the OLD family [Agrococcus baldri]|uniref:ATP-dependent endonuclease of the OLD family n=1 Tax=Agrococcus baldri TaxID=153730 RepID=A0AA94HN76_9MICO|nr:AAA family ATPase [Agrococcus baldri]SFS14739.1 putative ATP-dependent endonuclease of the OLD family [Agrococcus baldri]